MKECKEIKRVLTAHACGETTPQEGQRVAAHLAVCRDCMAAYQLDQRIFAGMENLNQESEKVIQTIDWQQAAHDISRSIRSRFFSKARRFSPSFALPGWRVLAPVTAAVFLLGIWLGYLLFYHDQAPGTHDLTQLRSADTRASLARLETTLARKEVSGYFKQTQLVLTDLMGQCDPGGMLTWQQQLNRERVKTLLKKSRYFEQNLDSPQLLSSKSLLKKIEWLLYEILTMDEEVSCDRLHRLQEYIRQERLLFKIELIEKDVDYSEV